MSTTLFSNQDFQNRIKEYDDPGTLILSTQKIRYRSMHYAKVVQCGQADCSELFFNALNEFYADAIILDLFDEWVAKNPEAIGAFLDDYDEGVYPDSNLIIVMENPGLQSEWELEHAVAHF